MNDYEAKQQARADRARELAEKNRREAGAREREFRRNMDMIPMGQPILVGHHSERGHRAHLKRIDGHMRASVEADRKADYHEHKAATIEGRLESDSVISSDDPDAVEKLDAKIKRLESEQERMKAVNRIVREKPRNERTDGKIERLVALGLNAGSAEKVFEPDFGGRIGIPAYALQNNNGNIRRLKARREEIAARAEAGETKEQELAGGIRIANDPGDNRTRVYFPGIPPEPVRAELKANGFRWSRQEKAWQRHLSTAAEHRARDIVARHYGEEVGL